MVRVGVTYSFRPQASDPDQDPLSFTISNKPGWAVFDSSTGALEGMPLLGDVGTYSDIEIAVSDGSSSASLSPFSVTVEATTAPNMPPEISGTPPTSVTIGDTYSFTASGFDPDGDALTYSVQNLPSWAAFDSSLGRLSGTPQPGDVGSYPNISITVSDNSESASMPAFSIEVVAGNTPPEISGTPRSAVNAGDSYAFTPTATDPDGDSLTFSVSGLPGWATFDSSTGRVSGTPVTADVGTYNNVTITVFDGSDSDVLGPFTITVNAISTGSVTLSWVAPTENTDGTALTDLAGYKIYYGTSEGSYPNNVVIDNAGVTTYVIDNLSPGIWYFVMTANNSAGVESSYSGVAEITVE